MLFCDSLFEYFDLISQIIYLKVLAFPPSLPHSFRDVSLALPGPGLLRGEARPGLAQPRPRTRPPRGLVVRWPTTPDRVSGCLRASWGCLTGQPQGRGRPKGRRQSRSLRSGACLTHSLQRWAGLRAVLRWSPLPPLRSQPRCCVLEGRGDSQAGWPPRTTRPEDGCMRPALRPAAPGPASPSPGHPHCMAGSEATPLASASPKGPGPGHPQAGPARLC